LATVGDYRRPDRCTFASVILSAAFLMNQLEIPNRSLFRQPEVCEIASIQPYVLRSWEAEFPDLGVAKSEGGPRIYRRADVERVLRIKQLLYGEGLTLAGVRRKLTEERPVESTDDAALSNIAELLGKDARERLLHVKRGLRELSVMLAKAPGDEAFQLQVDEAPAKKAVKGKKKR
jgi:DNA-binding transcriptional MerR regulator